MNREMANSIGAWWDTRRDHIQPSEFILRQDGSVIASTYSSSPVGRMDPQATLELITFLNKRARERS